MTTWPPSPDEIEIEEWTPDDLEVGDLIFCARSTGPLALLGKIAEEPWRHVGSLKHDANGDLQVVENLGPDFIYRDLESFFTSYETFGAARLRLSADCKAAANDWMSDRVESDQDVIYAWDDLVLAGIIAMTRRGIFIGRREQVRAALDAASQACKGELERRGAASLTCSAFIQIAYDQASDGCQIEHERWRTHTTWPPRAGSLDELFNSDRALEPFADMSITDLVQAQEEHDRAAGGMRMELSQVGECAKVLTAAIAGFGLHREPDEIRDDGRWVTPGDLWNSRTVLRRALLTP